MRGVTCGHCGESLAPDIPLCPHCGYDASLESPAQGGSAPVAGRYRKTRLLGEGGMGAVYEAVDLHTGARVALKLLHRLEPAGLARFSREARAMARVEHPNVAVLLDVGAEPGFGQPYLAMELIPGRTLKALFKEQARFEVARTVRIATQVLAALEAAHGVGVVHRDLTPANVIVGDADRVKVCDFGIAKVLDASVLTRTGVTLGTIGHMAPEQIKGEPVDARADLYSVGVLLYRMLVGRPPYDSASRAVVMFQQARTTPVPLRRIHEDIPYELEALTMAALSIDPGGRPRSARAMIEALSG